MNDYGNGLFLNNLHGGLEFLGFISTFLCKLGVIDRGLVDWWLPQRRDDCEPARLVRSHVALAHIKSTKSTDYMETVVLTVNLKL